mmetsp:Transcript_14014/g.33656  ORF Transcript_14014/g.33656 Transcript_14014/m.33656 type:complete len:139 (-) Transcript_14014:989-1405(-)
MWLSSEIHRRSRMMKMKALSIPMIILMLDISLPAAEWQKAMYGFAKRHNIRKLKRLKLSHDLLYTYENMICFLIKLVLVPAKRLFMFTFSTGTSAMLLQISETLHFDHQLLPWHPRRHGPHRASVGLQFLVDRFRYHP